MISDDSKKLIRDRLRTAKNEKKRLVSQIQILGLNKDALVAQKEALVIKIQNLEADLGR